MDHKVPDLNPSRGGIQLLTVCRFIAPGLSLSSLDHHSV